MAGNEPGERRSPGERLPPERDSGSRKLAEPPSARYAARPGGGPGEPGAGPGGRDREAERSGSALIGPLARALIAAILGAAALVALGAIFASTLGLLFTSAATGAGVGLLLARAAVPRDDPRTIPRRTIAWLAVGLSLGAVVTADVATWLIARQEGGTLALLDYLLTTFGPFVPGEMVFAAVAAWWGASSGPVQG
jgi:hypothetical protein